MYFWKSENQNHSNSYLDNPKPLVAVILCFDSSGIKGWSCKFKFGSWSQVRIAIFICSTEFFFFRVSLSTSPSRSLIIRCVFRYFFFMSNKYNCISVSMDFVKSFMISTDVLLSRFPVGSSASMIDGLFTNSYCPRCLCPPDNWFEWSIRSESPTCVKTSSAFFSSDFGILHRS
jgi:hypothetical protein